MDIIFSSKAYFACREIRLGVLNAMNACGVRNVFEKNVFPRLTAWDIAPKLVIEHEAIASDVMKCLKEKRTFTVR